MEGVLFLLDARLYSVVRPQLSLIRDVLERGFSVSDPTITRMAIALSSAIVLHCPDDAEAHGIDSMVCVGVYGCGCVWVWMCGCGCVWMCRCVVVCL